MGWHLPLLWLPSDCCFLRISPASLSAQSGLITVVHTVCGVQAPLPDAPLAPQVLAGLVGEGQGALSFSGLGGLWVLSLRAGACENAALPSILPLGMLEVLEVCAQGICQPLSSPCRMWEVLPGLWGPHSWLPFSSSIVLLFLRREIDGRMILPVFSTMAATTLLLTCTTQGACLWWAPALPFLLSSQWRSVLGL